MEEDLSAVYDEFQGEAVNCIVRDFTKKKDGRYLLVIPTGGGKTWTAVKAVNQLFEKGVLNSKSEKVLWITHRIELEDQARDTFNSYSKDERHPKSFDSRITYEHDLRKIKARVDEKDIALVVIDEAHHSKAESYQAIFSKTSVGVLGLTATPSRHDGAPLDFEDETYSIGFPDLIRKGVILEPIEEPPIKTGHHDNAEDLDAVNKDKLNNKERNSRIINVLHERHERYKKVVIYVGTKKHVKDLYQQMISSPLAEAYPSISWILGGPSNNSRGLKRRDFIETEKANTKSILINIEVLTEGYDDRTIDTVVMACPTKSTLKYMQAVGRAIRRNGDKKAYVVPVEDDLPNVRYRFSNRWLYADISDALEPEVIDKTYSDETLFKESLLSVYEDGATYVAEENRVFPLYKEDDRYSLVLFKVYGTKEKIGHLPILLNKRNRNLFKARFDFLSERLAHDKKLQKRKDSWAWQKGGRQQYGCSWDQDDWCKVWEAMQFSACCIANYPDPPGPIKLRSKPWISLVVFRFEPLLIDPLLLEFLEDMVNKERLLEDLQQRNFDDESVLIKIPLPLGRSKGIIVQKLVFIRIKDIVDQMQHLFNKEEGDHMDSLNAYFSRVEFPIELRYKSCITIIIRENIDYYREL